jgi:hypothetical protein
MNSLLLTTASTNPVFNEEPSSEPKNTPNLPLVSKEVQTTNSKARDPRNSNSVLSTQQRGKIKNVEAVEAVEDINLRTREEPKRQSRFRAHGVIPYISESTGQSR